MPEPLGVPLWIALVGLVCTSVAAFCIGVSAGLGWGVTRYRRSESEGPPVHEPPVEPGQRWVLAAEYSDPFPKLSRHAVEVLDCRQGWVRYRFLPVGGMWQDQRMAEDVFRHVYRLAPERLDAGVH